MIIPVTRAKMAIAWMCLRDSAVVCERSCPRDTADIKEKDSAHHIRIKEAHKLCLILSRTLQCTILAT